MATPEPTTDPVESTTEETVMSTLTGVGLFTQYFGAYGILIIDIVGLIGNLLTVYVFITKRNKTGPVAIYFVCLAISDSGNLVMGLHTWFHNGLFYITNGAINIPIAVSDIACMFRVYIWNVFVAMSGYVIVAFSAERVIAIYFPLKASTLITNSRRIGVLVGLTVFSAVTPLPFFVIKYRLPYVVNGVTRYACGGNWDEGSNIANIYLTVMQQFHFFVPLVLILVLNLSIIVGIKRATETDVTKSKTKVMDKKIVLNLLMVSFLYILTIGTYAIFRLIETSYETGLLVLSKEAGLAFKEWAALATNIAVLNYASNFIIYSLSLDFYREAIKNLLCGCFRKDKQTMESNITASSTAGNI